MEALSIFLLAFLILVVLRTFYKWATKDNRIFETQEIPYEKPTFLLGTNFEFLTGGIDLKEFICSKYNRFPDASISGLFDFLRPIWLIRSPQVLKLITIKDFNKFRIRNQVISEETDFLFGSSLPHLDGEKWYDMRVTLSPLFSSLRIKEMFALVNQIGQSMSEYFQAQYGDGVYEMKDLFSRFTNDTIASCAFGLEINSLKDRDNVFYAFGKRVSNMVGFNKTLRFLGLRLVPSLMKAFNMSFIGKSESDYFIQIIKEAIELREKQGIVRPDVLNLLIQMKKDGLKVQENQECQDNSYAAVEEMTTNDRSVIKRQWKCTEMLAQCFIFFFAGFETSSTVMSFIAYELAINPQIQDKLAAEVDKMNEFLGGKEITYEAMNKMRYLDMVVTEGLRKYPAFPFVERVCTKDYILKYDDGKELVLKKGDLIWIPIIGLHYSEEFWDRPEKFDPDRFNEESRGSLNPGAFLPFGSGPRNCIGSRFGLMNIKIALYYMIKEARVEICPQTDIPLKMKKGFTMLLTQNGVWLKLKSRKKST